MMMEGEEGGGIWISGAPKRRGCTFVGRERERGKNKKCWLSGVACVKGFCWVAHLAASCLPNTLTYLAESIRVSLGCPDLTLFPNAMTTTTD